MTIDFWPLDYVSNDELIFAVIAAQYQGEWVFVRNKARDTYEIPGGHREAGEDAAAAGRRELYEETGALDFDLVPVTQYSVTREDETRFGLLCYADIKVLGPLPEMEIAEVILKDELPESLTYPDIQPVLFERVREFLRQKT